MSKEVKGISEAASFDCVGMGHCAFDYICLLDRYPGENEKTEAIGYSEQGGGPVATAMVTLARLGAKVAFVGRVGDDREGRFVREEFRREGVDISALQIRASVRTPQAFVWVNTENGHRSIVLNRTHWQPPRWEEMNTDVLENTPYLHLDGRFPDWEIPAARFVKSRGGKIVVDVGSVRDEMESLFEIVDYFVASENFLRQFAPKSSLKKALAAIRARGPSTVVVTLGEKGSAGIDSSGFFHFPAFSVSVVDTTGAGDVFHGAFIFGLIREWNLPKILAFSNAVAALKCTRPGGREGIPNLETTLRFLRERNSVFFEKEEIQE